MDASKFVMLHDGMVAKAKGFRRLRLRRVQVAEAYGAKWKGGKPPNRLYSGG